MEESMISVKGKKKTVCLTSDGCDYGIQILRVKIEGVNEGYPQNQYSGQPRGYQFSIFSKYQKNTFVSI